MNIYQYSLGIDGIRERVYEDVYTNSKRDKFIIDELDDLGGDVLCELYSVDTDKLTTHCGYGDNLYLNYSERKSDEYIKHVMYEGFRKEIIEVKNDCEYEVEMFEYYQNLLKGVE